MIRFNPFEKALDQVSQAIIEHQTTPETEAELIRWAHWYAKKNRLEFDGTLAGVIKLAAVADQHIRDHRLRMEYEEAVRKAREFAEHRKRLFEMG